MVAAVAAAATAMVLDALVMILTMATLTGLDPREKMGRKERHLNKWEAVSGSQYNQERSQRF